MVQLQLSWCGSNVSTHGWVFWSGMSFILQFSWVDWQQGFHSSSRSLGHGITTQLFQPVFTWQQFVIVIFRVGALVITICGLKMMRNGFVHTSWQFVVVSLTVLLFKYDFPKNNLVYCQTAFCSETFPIDYFFASLFLWKVVCLLCPCTAILSGRFLIF